MRLRHLARTLVVASIGLFALVRPSQAEAEQLGYQAAPGPAFAPEQTHVHAEAPEQTHVHAEAPLPPGYMLVGGHVGGLLASEFEEFVGTAAGGVTFRIAKPVTKTVALGFRQALFVSSLPYGDDDDGEHFLGRRAPRNLHDYKYEVTFFPSSSLLVEARPRAVLGVFAAVGMGLVASAPLSPAPALVPRPVVATGIELQVYHSRSARFALGASADVLFIVSDKRLPVILLPQVGPLFYF